MSNAGRLARQRIEHLVVLILENRSFDNLLGFLDHPSRQYPKVVRVTFPNRLDPLDAASGVGVSDDGDHGVEVDPPHGHFSVMEQLNLDWYHRAHMDGFVRAHERKAIGKEERPVVHWWRLGALVAVFAGISSTAVSRALGMGRLSHEIVIERYLVIGMGHAWSGGAPEGTFTDPAGPDASSIIWAFLRGASPEGSVS